MAPPPPPIIHAPPSESGTGAPPGQWTSPSSAQGCTGRLATAAGRPLPFPPFRPSTALRGGACHPGCRVLASVVSFCFLERAGVGEGSGWGVTPATPDKVLTQQPHPRGRGADGAPPHAAAVVDLPPGGAAHPPTHPTRHWRGRPTPGARLPAPVREGLVRAPAPRRAALHPPNRTRLPEPAVVPP